MVEELSVPSQEIELASLRVQHMTFDSKAPGCGTCSALSFAELETMVVQALMAKAKLRRLRRSGPDVDVRVETRPAWCETRAGM
jgi:hypothetical protein